MSHANYLLAARAALARAACVRAQSPSYDENAVSDLLTDIRHLCAADGMDFERCLRVAGMHFEAETGGAS